MNPFRTRQSRIRHNNFAAIMDNTVISARPRNRFWSICFVLFLFWFLMIYGFDCPYLPGISSLSHRQQDSLQTLDSAKSDVYKSNQAYQEINIHSPDSDPSTTEEKMKMKYEDVETMEKELEPLPLKEDEEKGNLKSCAGRYIYIHEIPPRFNSDYIKNCKSLNKWHDMCRYFANDGLGQPLGNPQRLFMHSGWYVTHQFSLEVIFHNRMKRYRCLTKDPSKATAFYVPYYPGLDVSRYLFDSYKTSMRDADSLDLFKCLKAKPEWNGMGGRDHFLVAGRITWDFRRVVDEDSAWGSKFMVLPESKNMTILIIESSPWDKNDFAIPYPTYFHPSNDDEVIEWQNKVGRQRRKTLFCFAGAPRPDMDTSIRSEIMQQCRASRQRCRMVECINDKENCLKPANVMKMFMGSVFCLQPPGDSFTRRSAFDTIIAGCIPVFFTPASAYVQYLWHLPKDFGSYSVMIPEGDVKQKNVSIERFLSHIPKSQILAMRERVVKLIPKVIYADPRGSLEKLEDAFDLTISGVVKRVEELKKEMREGRRNSDEFNSESSWKYYTFGTTKPHEWDHYFDRSKFM